MKEPGIEDATLEVIIPDAAKGDKDALNSLFNHPWLYMLLNKIAEWAQRRYRIVHDERGRDVETVVSDAIRRKITTLKNPRQILWRTCLKAWCYTVARRHCLNVIYDRREETYRETVMHENTDGSRNGRKMITPCSNEKTEAEEREQERQESVTKSHIEKIDQAIWEVHSSLTPEGKRIVSLWANMKTLQQIAAETNSNIETVRRKLKNIQQAFVKRFGEVAEEIGHEVDKETAVEQVQENLLAHRAKDLRELIAAGLQEGARRGRHLHAGS